MSGRDRKANSALKTDYFKLLADSADDFIYIIDRDLRVSYINRSGAASINRSQETVVGKPLGELFPPSTYEGMKGHLATVFETGKPLTSMHSFQFFDKEIWLHVKLTPLIENGEVTHVMGISRDITEREHLFNSLRESEEKYRSLIDGINDWVWELDEHLVIVYSSSKVEDITGFGVTEMLGKRLFDLMPPEEVERLTSIIDPIIRSPRPFEFVFTAMGKGGRPVILECSGKPVFDHSGAVKGYRGITKDVTERTRAEEALKLAQFTLETSEDAVSWIDSEARVIYVNDAACKSLGYARDELLFMRVSDVDPNFPLERWPEFWREAREMGHLVFESTHRSRDGRIYPVEITVDFVKSGDKEFISSFARDITERKRAEEALWEAKAQAELYLDLMGHDINNMHQIALGYLEMARGMMQINEVEQELLDKSIEVLQRSAQLISNVRKLQKLREGVLQIDTVDVAEVLSDVLKEYGAVPSKTMTLNLNGNEHYYVLANELLHDVFSNIVGNAVKYAGDEAEITIDIDRVEEDGKRFCRIIVEDDGPGIPDDAKAKIFNRIHKGTARGMGLGLYLVKSLLNSYDGKVWAGDRIAGDHTKGARFVVMLPAIEAGSGRPASP